MCSVVTWTSCRPNLFEGVNWPALCRCGLLFVIPASEDGTQMLLKLNSSNRMTALQDAMALTKVVRLKETNHITYDIAVAGTLIV